MAAAVLERLALVEDLHVTGLVISWRGRRAVTQALPAGVDARWLRFPARLAHELWQRIDQPSVGGFDIVHGPNFVVPPARGGVELVTIHDFGPWRFPELVTPHSRSYPRLVDRAVRRGADVHCVSQFSADEAVELLGISRDRVHVVHNGLDASPSTGRLQPPDPARAQSLAGGPFVLALGTVEPRKDLPTLVHALSILRREHQDVRLVVAGPDGWGAEAFDASVVEFGVVDGVVRLGFVPEQDRVDLLAGALCLAYPSRYEGFGLPPLEAMAHRTPVVTTTAGSLPEVCGDAALLVEPGDAEAMADSIAQIINDQDVTARLVEAGEAQVERFSWDRASSELLALYRSLANRGA